MGKRIGVVTGGGDCPGLNAVIRSVAKAAARRGWETIGIIGGYDGLLPPGNVCNLDYHALDGLLVKTSVAVRVPLAFLPGKVRAF
jgi:6-phosphofructokinase 1